VSLILAVGGKEGVVGRGGGAEVEDPQPGLAVAGTRKWRMPYT
jgi:hypothetical protein